MELSNIIVNLLVFGAGFYLGHIHGWNSLVDEYNNYMDQFEEEDEDEV